jgi:hypothetical protein
MNKIAGVAIFSLSLFHCVSGKIRTNRSNRCDFAWT